MSRPVRPSRGESVSLVVRGFVIGCADLVPGVSGGTVALVTGIYPRLLAAIGGGAAAVGRVIKGDLRGSAGAFRSIDWRFLIPVTAGVAVAIVSLARVIEGLLRDYPVRTAAVFLGLIVGAVIVAWWILRAPGGLHAVVAGAVGVAAFFLFGLRSSAVVGPSWYVFFGAGALAICAFILPGVSGSFLLLAIGMYQEVLGAVTGARFSPLVVFALGAAIGLGVFSRILNRLLDRHHDVVVVAMIGLMIGSFRILWPWPNGLGDETGAGATVLGVPGPDVVVPVLLAAASAFVVVGFAAWIEGRRPRRGPR